MCAANAKVLTLDALLHSSFETFVELVLDDCRESLAFVVDAISYSIGLFSAEVWHANVRSVSDAFESLVAILSLPEVAEIVDKDTNLVPEVGVVFYLFYWYRSRDGHLRHFDNSLVDGF